MKILGIIPSRFASTRLPGKPLTDIVGKSMIQRVYESCLQSRLVNEWIVATDDQRIENHIVDIGGKVLMTNPSHQSGTDRCAEVLELTGGSYDMVINVQGDEPLIHPEQIDLLATHLTADTEIATLIKLLESDSQVSSPNLVKVVTTNNNLAMYFSRSVIPYYRDTESDLKKFYQHIGMYAYRSDVLQAICKLPTSSLEQAEKLEQLRWLQSGYQIQCVETTLESTGVDTPEDLDKVIAIIQNQNR